MGVDKNNGVKDRVGARYLPSPHQSSPAWKERVNTNGKSERTRDDRGAYILCLPP
jgi:hypothetical protein